jgi:hypothetical protein
VVAKMSDPRTVPSRPKQRRRARFSNSRWTESIMIAIAIAVAALSYFLVELFDLPSWRQGHAAILFVIVPPGLFVILTYDRLSRVIDGWLAPKDRDPTSGSAP